ncbi:Hypothetical predicted protein [Xyrichtys novacula]|uniref:Uncharacterized protein n=1 Tax=Xyrichtys novacula TaxID=13765 RepID=A0AAV1HQ82_XYRNO|nr:Hypothetical predicted protein [Xyrichtys novacula]
MLRTLNLKSPLKPRGRPRQIVAFISPPPPLQADGGKPDPSCPPPPDTWTMRTSMCVEHLRGPAPMEIFLTSNWILDPNVSSLNQRWLRISCRVQIGPAGSRTLIALTDPEPEPEEELMD